MFLGNPKNFQRVTHIGYDCKVGFYILFCIYICVFVFVYLCDSKVGFDLDSADPKILKFFEKVKPGYLDIKGKFECPCASFPGKGEKERSGR